jgi:isoquinoline 1-oxidoreductase beta subunit
VTIGTDGAIVILNPASEMGQGSMTALPVMVAEEMDADWAMVRIEDAPIEPDVYGSDGWGGGKIMVTAGSRSVNTYFDPLRIAGAQIRRVLMENAARSWDVPVAEAIRDRRRGARQQRRPRSGLAG